MQITKYEKEAIESFNKFKFSQALIAANKALANNKKSQIAQLIIGLSLLNLQKYQEAEEALQIAIKNQQNREIAFKNLSKVQFILKKYKDAEDSLLRALEIKPRWIDCLFDLAHLKQTIGQLNESENIYKEIIAIDPKNIGAYNNLGVLFRTQQRYTEARNSIKKALELDPEYIHANINMTGVLNSLNMPQEGIEFANKALTKEPNNTAALGNIADSYRMLKKYEIAQPIYEKALELQPRESSLYNGLGQLLGEKKALKEALTVYQKAINLGLVDHALYCNLGALYVELHEFEKAEEMYLKALQLNSKFSECYSNLGILYTKQGRYEEATKAYDNAIELNPEFIAPINNKANMLGALGKHHESIKIFEKLINSGKANELTYTNAASAYYNIGAINNAIQSAKKSIEFGSSNHQSYNNLGLAQKDWCLFDEAIASFKKALAIDKDAESVYDNLLFTINYHPNLTSEEIFEYYKKYGDQFPKIELKDKFSNRKINNKKIKIGYVSPDFKKHACSQFIWSFLENYDSENFELFAYADNIIEDEVTQEYKKKIKNWRKTSNINDESLEKIIQNDEIDILVDLAGHTKGNRLKVFAKKPAPISITYLGFGYTTGLKSIDYFLACDFSVPKGTEYLFSEKVWRLPSLGCYSNTNDIPQITPLPAIENKYITFCALSRSIRINDNVIATWAEILKLVENSLLIINSSDYSDEISRERILKKFAEHGISTERLTVGFKSPPWETLQKSDISLDCFPHNSGTTLYESLYMGVPFITLSDRPSMGRWGGAILTTAGYPQWITLTREEYINKAKELSSDIEKLSNIRNQLRSNVVKTTLFNQNKFIHQMELEYKKMWKIFCEE
jgi:protein O-GlcNAc transferase